MDDLEETPCKACGDTMPCGDMALIGAGFYCPECYGRGVK